MHTTTIGGVEEALLHQGEDGIFRPKAWRSANALTLRQWLNLERVGVQRLEHVPKSTIRHDTALDADNVEIFRLVGKRWNVLAAVKEPD